MTYRKLTLLAAALAGVMAAMSVTAQDRNRSGYSDSGDRGVGTPAMAPDASGPTRDRGGAGPSYIPSINSPASVPDERSDQVGRKNQPPLVRDSRTTPSPTTPGNVSDANPSANRKDQTNDGGGLRPGSGATR